jgi:hypothetical protein
VDYEIHIVHQDPLAELTTFDRIWVCGELPFQLKFDAVCNGLRLSFVDAAGDQEKISETRIHGVEFQDFSVLPFFVFADAGRSQYHLASFVRCHLGASILLDC